MRGAMAALRRRRTRRRRFYLCPTVPCMYAAAFNSGQPMVRLSSRTCGWRSAAAGIRITNRFAITAIAVQGLRIQARSKTAVRGVKPKPRMFCPLRPRQMDHCSRTVRLCSVAQTEWAAMKALMPNCAAAAPRATSHFVMQRTRTSDFELKRRLAPDSVATTRQGDLFVLGLWNQPQEKKGQTRSTQERTLDTKRPTTM